VSPPPRDRKRRSDTRVKLGYKETRELEELPDRIELLERKQAEITRQLCSPEIYRDHPDEARVLQQQNSAIEEELMVCLARWEELEAKSLPGRQRV
jgi:ATP-binding cassette subfamily F protein uup